MRPLRDVLATEAALAGLIERRRHELLLQALLGRLLPPALASQTVVADATRAELILATATGAVATLVRHRSPEVLDRLAREGWKFTGIRVRVQVGAVSPHPSKFYAKQMDGAAAAALRAGASAIVDPDLAAALRRLAGHAAESERHDQPLEGVEEQHARKEK